MPEIVEVKKYADFINKSIKNQKLINIKIINGRYKTHKPFDNYRKLLNNLPLKINEINTKGKFMYMKLKDDLIIGITLGLTGGWFYLKNNTERYKYPGYIDNIELTYMNGYIKTALEHINVEFIFEKGKLLFHDQLSFGTIKIFDNEKEFNKKLNLLGLDIMDSNTNIDNFILAIKKKNNLNKEIGIILMNQKIISGIGNYLRADSLWYSKISPFRKVKDLSNKDLQELFDSLRLLTWSIYNYKLGVKLKIIDPKDKIPINLENDFLIYGKEFDINGQKIIKEKLYEGSQIRYIYWVKNYQK